VSFRLSDEQIPDETPWRDEEFLWWAYHERDLSPRTIAYELGVEKSRVTVHMDRLGVLKPWTHKHNPRTIARRKRPLSGRDSQAG
jgi:DNA-binding MarR family transcriptional regulator